MAELVDRAPEIADRVRGHTAAIVGALRALDDAGLRAPSSLPGWDRLTIACHLRYGAVALARMTGAATSGRATAYYPGGRDRERPATLEPRPGESASDVVESLAARSHQLDAAWSALMTEQWGVAVQEPREQTDLGPLLLAAHALLRLTEVEVHGLDLDVGLDRWSDLFVELALPFRLAWLNTRRANRRPADRHLRGSWCLQATDGAAWVVTFDGHQVRSDVASPTAEPATAVIEASRRDLLALILGRPCVHPPRVSGDAAFAAAFGSAVPGP
jgi:maleylpyruvate isomerase